MPLGRVGQVTSADGVSIAYRAEGKGPVALVFIHGWCCDSSYWSAQRVAFVPDYLVVTLDLAGHGESGRERARWTLPAFGADVQAVVEALGIERALLIGHSMGGPVSLEAARRMPERVIGLVGVDTLHDAEFQFDPEPFQELLEQYRNDFAGTCDEFVRSLFARSATTELVDRVAAKLCSSTPPEVAIELLQQFPGYDVGAAMAAVQVPIRCINSSRYPTQVATNRKYAADFDAVSMTGVGHFPMLERPDEFNQIMRRVVAELTGPSPKGQVPTSGPRR
ncbi:MAG: alpha/beta hydrolase [Planctomycetota bacterium]